MKFIHRFAYYLLGLSIGIIFLIFFLSGKNTRCSYFPNARVLNDLSNKPIHYSDTVSTALTAQWIDTIDIRNCLKYGKVDFSKSNTTSYTGKIYIINGKTSNYENIILEVVNMPDYILLKNVRKTKKK